jgi:hypothetical protein
MKKIKELQNRSKLNEGRNFGTGFTILNKKGSKFETYLPFTACRDYLNDFIYCELAKEEIGNACGYEHKVLNCFDNKRLFYLGVNTLHTQRRGKYNQFDQHKKLLIENYKNLESLLNIIESKLNLKYKSKIELDEDTLIIKAPIYWTKSTALISVYTLFIRCFFDVNEIITEENIDNIIETKKPFIASDSFYNYYKVFYNNMLNRNFIKLDYKPCMKYSKTGVHSFGIQKAILQVAI